VEWMKNIEQKIADFDWQTVTGDINEKSIHFGVKILTWSVLQ
jgi:hypothetical protein